MHVIKNNCKWYFKYLRGIATSRELITAYKIKTRMAGPHKEVDATFPAAANVLRWFSLLATRLWNWDDPAIRDRVSRL
jgi:hypothetical protein